VIACSLFSDIPRYVNGAIVNARLIDELLPGWTLRVYRVPRQCVIGQATVKVGAGDVAQGPPSRSRRGGKGASGQARRQGNHGPSVEGWLMTAGLRPFAPAHYGAQRPHWQGSPAQ
jgi:hypothetical protein